MRQLGPAVVQWTRWETGLAVMAMRIDDQTATRELTLHDGSVWLLFPDGILHQTKETRPMPADDDTQAAQQHI